MFSKKPTPPDFAQMIEAAAQTTGFHRNTLLEKEEKENGLAAALEVPAGELTSYGFSILFRHEKSVSSLIVSIYAATLFPLSKDGEIFSACNRWNNENIAPSLSFMPTGDEDSFSLTMQGRLFLGSWVTEAAMEQFVKSTIGAAFMFFSQLDVDRRFQPLEDFLFGDGDDEE